MKIKPIIIGNRKVGIGEACFIVGEIGINHNGELGLAKRLIDLAKEKGFDGVKFQKRTPDRCVPKSQKKVIRQTPWGKMTYLQYKKKLEFGLKEYDKINRYSKNKKIIWFASVWDRLSVDRLKKYNPPCYKIPSALITHKKLLKKVSKLGKPIILSTGMSSLKEIDTAVEILKENELIILHCTSSYPAKVQELNLRFMKALWKRYGRLVGYSGHETGITPSIIAVAAYKAVMVERHITTSRVLWGSDHAASLEPRGMELLTRDIRNIVRMKGEGKKVLYESEKSVKKKLRRF